MEQITYPDLEALMLLYKNGDLPEGEMAFKYMAAPGKEAWIHIDELRKQLSLRSVYPQANTTKGRP